MSRYLRFILISLFTSGSLLLLACVPVSDPKNRFVDEEKALDSHLTLGMAYLKQGDRDASRRNFEKALEINKNAPRAHNGMGLLYQLTGESALAEKSYKRAIALDGIYTEARVNYGAFLYQKKRFQEAYEIFERAATDLSYGRRALVLAYVGQAANKLNNTERAKSAFEHSLNLDNKLSLPLLELAQINFNNQKYADAKNYLDQYASIAKASPKSLWLGIRIERIFGNKDKEASYVLALRNLYPYSKEYLEYKSLIKQIGSD